MELSPLRHSDGNKIIISISDVSALIAARQKLLDEHERALVTLRAIADGVITTDTQGIVQSINPVAEKLSGWGSNEAIGQHISEVFQVIDEKTQEKVSDSVIECLDQKSIVELGANKVLIHRNGIKIPIEDSAAPIHSSKGEIIGAVLVFHDVSQSRAYAHEVEYQANHDELTGLLNRREFDARLGKSIVKARETASDNVLLFMDLDRFKLVNDTAGHAAGDELLKQITKLMSGKLRQRDTFARLGGDEFAILLEHCSEEVGLKLANIIRAGVEDFRFFWNSQVFNIGVSIGMVPFSGSAESADNILSEADAACYTAKESGRNRVQIYDVTAAQKRGESTIINLLVEAFENCRMQLYQQPIRATDPANEQPHFEILLRMLSENGDVISPGMFLPAAERYGLATTLDRWVVKTTFDWLAQHQSSFNQAFVFAINISGQSITDQQFSLFIKQQFEDYRIKKSSICFEITETSAMKDLEKARAFINDLKHLGCLFSLDDFGSGHASYAHLKNLPVNFLKIDGMFVKDIAHDPIDFSIVKSMNEVGQVLGMKTIAEYVENDAIKQKLIDIGVDFLQGYGIARPAPLDDLLLEIKSQPLIQDMKPESECEAKAPTGM
ncbi:MAG: EAL domain-containing protein [Gammaproteobacteria bacterium]|nr:EAL domain-containing protein [Gammaproteobacteria bacterium]